MEPNYPNYKKQREKNKLYCTSIEFGDFVPYEITFAEHHQDVCCWHPPPCIFLLGEL